MPIVDRHGNPVDLPPDVLAQIEEARPHTAEERDEVDRVRAWYQKHRPASATQAQADHSADPIFAPTLRAPLANLLARLRAERDRLGLSLADVAERSGLTRSAISRLENGKRENPTLDTLYRYANALGATITLGVEPMSGDQGEAIATERISDPVPASPRT